MPRARAHPDCVDELLCCAGKCGHATVNMCGTEQKVIADTPQCGHKRVTHFSTRSSPSSTCCIIFSRLSLSSCNRQVHITSSLLSLSLSPSAKGKKYTLHCPFSVSLLLQQATGASLPPPPPHPPPATSKKYTLHFPLALSLLLQQPTSTRCIFLCQSFCPCDTQQVHITFPLGSASPPATDNEYTLHLPFFLSSCRNRQQVHIRSSLLSLLLQQATCTHYIFPTFSPLATGNKYT